MTPRARLRWLLLGALLLAAGCGDAGRLAERYRIEQIAYRAQKGESELRLGRSRPDSTALLKLRREYAKSRAVGKAPFTSGPTERSRQIGRDVLRQIASAEAQGARLAMQAGRPDLALAQSEWLEAHSEGDSAASRQADFIALGALRQMGRTEEAIARIRSMLRRHPPAAPPKGTMEEDPLLSLPEVMAAFRSGEGDGAGAARELENAVGYFESLLRTPRPPALEAQIRARIVRIQIERRQPAAALEQVTLLERLVASNPSLKVLEPELRYSRAKIRIVMDPKPDQAIAMLERFVGDYPRHGLAPQALFDAAVYLEDAHQFDRALAHYREIVALYPNNEEIAPVALFRQAILEERTGNWSQAKATLESVPVKYPRSQASAEAPFTIAARYYARGEKDAAKSALARAVGVYEGLIAHDSTSIFTPVYRFNILRAHLSLGQWDQALATVDEMALKNRRHPYTAQALLEGAKVANANRQKDRAAGYLQQYLEDYPRSPLAEQVRQSKDKLLR